MYRIFYLLVSLSLFIPTATFAHFSSGDGLNITPERISSPSDNIPRLCRPGSDVDGGAVVTSVQAGSFFDPATWGGSLPPADARILIEHAVSYDDVSNTAYQCIEIRDGGRLDFATDRDTKLRLDGELLVMPLGALTIGTATNPVTANVTADISFTGEPLQTGTVQNPRMDPSQYGVGLLAFGDIETYGTPKNQTFIRLAEEPAAGDTTLTLVNAPTGWQVGDRVVLPAKPDNSSNVKSEPPATDTKSIASISGSTLVLDSPLLHDYPGARDADGSITRLPNGELLLPHVINITRNIRIRSADPAESGRTKHCYGEEQVAAPIDCATRAHVMILHRAQASINYTAFEYMGRMLATEKTFSDNTTYDANGNPTYIGTNQIGRYSLHAHHVWGPRNPTNTGFQITINGNSITDPLKWAYVLHDTHYADISNNVVVGVTDAEAWFDLYQDLIDQGYKNSPGVPQQPMGAVRVNAAGFVTEETEGDMSFIGNGSFNAGGIDSPPYNSQGSSGEHFWFRDMPKDLVARGNVSAGIVLGNANTGMTFMAQGHRAVEDNRFPLFRGASMVDPNEYEEVNGRLVDIDVESHESYYLRSGLHTWVLTATGIVGHGAPDEIGTAAQHTFRNLVCWHVAGCISPKFTTNYTLENVLVRQAFTALDFKLPHFVQADNTTRTISGADIQDSVFGIRMPANPIVRENDGTGENFIGGNYIIENAFIDATKSGLLNSTRMAGNNSTPADPDDVILRNVTFSPSTPISIEMEHIETFGDGKYNITLPNRLFSYDHNGVAGANYQFYFTEQAPDFPMSQTRTKKNNQGNDVVEMVGCPSADLTNQQCLAQHGVTTAAVLAPCVGQVGDSNTGPDSCNAAADLAASLNVSGLAFVFDGDPPDIPPKLSISDPTNGDSIIGDIVTVTYSATPGDYEAADHIHLKLDDNPDVPGLPLGVGQTYTFTNVPLGSHTITGYMAETDHTPIEGTDVSVDFTTVDDGGGGSDPNDPPTLTLDPDQSVFTVIAGEATTIFTALASDSNDGDTLTLEILDLETLLPGALFE